MEGEERYDSKSNVKVGGCTDWNNDGHVVVADAHAAPDSLPPGKNEMAGKAKCRNTSATFMHAICEPANASFDGIDQLAAKMLARIPSIALIFIRVKAVHRGMYKPFVRNRKPSFVGLGLQAHSVATTRLRSSLQFQ
jgi:hypothetical protein